MVTPEVFVGQGGIKVAKCISEGATNPKNVATNSCSGGGGGGGSTPDLGEGMSPFPLLVLPLGRVCFKGTNSRQKTYEIFHVYRIFYSGFMRQTTVIFGITEDGSLVLNTLAS